MKKSFEGKIHLDVPDDWDTLAKKPLLPASTLETLKTASGTVFRCVVHPEYVCTEYNMKLNLFTFGRLSITVVQLIYSSDTTWRKSDDLCAKESNALHVGGTVRSDGETA